MIVHVIVRDESVEVIARAEGDGLVGDMRHEVGSGEKFLGKTYEQWRELGTGQHTI
jgi:hypothetical protein